MHDNAVATLLMAQNPGAIVLVGQPSFRIESELQRVQQSAAKKGAERAGNNGANIICVDNMTLLAQYLSNAAAKDDKSFNDMAICLFLPAGADSAHNCLGAACRVAPKLVLVEHAKSQSNDKLLDDEQFFAHGFRKITSQDAPNTLQSHWYAYSLRDYKQAPDWLNARFWAHPERFGLMD